jgi:ELWxxDGT repeat protein
MSDGTETGTVMVYDINPGGRSSIPYQLTNINGNLLFNADDGTHGFELWMSNGTASGTKMIQDINPGSDAGMVDTTELINIDGVLFFTAYDNVNGYTLWRFTIPVIL